MQFSYLHFKYPNILHTLDELSRSNFFLGSITPKTPDKLSGKDGPQTVTPSSKYRDHFKMQIFLFADAFQPVTAKKILLHYRII